MTRELGIGNYLITAFLDSDGDLTIDVENCDGPVFEVNEDLDDGSGVARTRFMRLTSLDDDEV
jgi:hypothetical protein